MTIQTSKTSIFHETSPKNDNPDFEDKHFPRDFPQKWQSRLPKQAFSTETLTKTENRDIQSEHFPRDFHKK